MPLFAMGLLLVKCWMGMAVVFGGDCHLPPVIRTIVLSVDIVAVLLEKRLARFKDWLIS